MKNPIFVCTDQRFMVPDGVSPYPATNMNLDMSVKQQFAQCPGDISGYSISGIGCLELLLTPGIFRQEDTRVIWTRRYYVKCFRYPCRLLCKRSLNRLRERFPGDVLVALH